MQKYLLTLCFLIIGGLITTDRTIAQETIDSQGALLPDIDPQDIEIRSQYRARFPGLRRQPILGFTPGSRVFQVDPNRMPFFEDREEIAAQLPVGELTRPAAPDYSFFPYAERSKGYGRLGFGNFLTPEMEIYLSQQVGEKQFLSGGLDYTSGNGHLDQRSSFREMDFHAGYLGSVSRRTVMNTSVGGKSDFNYMILPEGVATSENPGRKTFNAFDGAIGFTRYRNPVNYFEGGIEGMIHSIKLDGGGFQLADELSDWRTGANLGYNWAGRRIHERFAVKADLQAGGYDSDSGLNDYWHIFNVSASYNRLINYRTRFGVTLGVAHGSDAADNSSVHFTPDLRIEHTITDYAGISASLSGDLRQMGHTGHHGLNPFLIPGNPLRNSYDLMAATELVLEPLPGNQIRIGTSYQSIKNYGWYERQNVVTGVGVVPAHYTVAYDDVTIPRAYAGIGVDLIRERLWFDVEGYMQTPRITDDQKVPFREEYGFTGAVTLRPVDLLLFEVWGSFIGPRSLPEGSSLPAYLDLGSKLELKITERVGIYGKIVNLLNQDYQIWQGYTERPFQIFGGVTLHF